jgi:hypothetical protein
MNMLTHDYSGPKVNIEHHMLGREENVIDGKDGSEGSESGSVAREAAREAADKKVTEVV